MPKGRTTVYINAHVHTFDAEARVAQAFAVSGEEIIAVGPERYVRNMAGDFPEVVDLEGAHVTPGLVDAHVHLIDYGLTLQRMADLSGCRSVAELQERLRGHMRRLEETGSPLEWVLGHGFDHELLETRAFPTRQDLDEVSRERPVVIRRLCGHAAVGNTRALELCRRPLPEESRSTGLVTEDDVGLLMEGVPPATVEEIDRAILQSGDLAASLGITGVHCLIVDVRQIDRLFALHGRGILPIRFYVMFSYSLLEEMVERGFHTGSGDPWVTIGAAKIFADGALGARTAALWEDYADDPGNRGMMLIEQAELTDMIKHAQSHGFQTATHAIGDRAVDVTVSAIEAACAHQNNRLRHRIEHASQMTQKALVKMAHYTIPAAVQPQFIITDFWTRDRVGERRYRWSYPFRTMLRAGVPLAMSSDCYVERLDPYELIYRAWVRDEHSRDEALTPFETMRAYTLGSAFAGHQENDRGSIEEGKLADLVVYPENPFELSREDILQLRPEFTIVGGRRHRPTLPLL